MGFHVSSEECRVQGLGTWDVGLMAQALDRTASDLGFRV